ncbi:MAG: hypothetical protein ACHQEM_10845, partial [Chitinophagales bacterium]
LISRPSNPKMMQSTATSICFWPRYFVMQADVGLLYSGNEYISIKYSYLKTKILFASKMNDISLGIL